MIQRYTPNLRSLITAVDVGLRHENVAILNHPDYQNVTLVEVTAPIVLANRVFVRIPPPFCDFVWRWRRYYGFP